MSSNSGSGLRRSSRLAKQKTNEKAGASTSGRGGRQPKRKLVDLDSVEVEEKKNSKRKQNPCGETGVTLPKNQGATRQDIGSTAPGLAAVKAMQNKLVLATIAKKLPAVDLRKLRRTCSLWNRCFVPELQNKHNSVRVSSVQPDWLAPMDDMLQGFTDLMRSSLAIPITQYRIFDLTNVRHHIFKNFFAVCGKSIRRLGIEAHWELDKSVNVDRIRQAVFQLTPELVELSINTDDEPAPVWSSRQKGRFAKELPKLRKLTFSSSTLSGSLHRAYGDLLIDILKCSVGLEWLSFEEGDHAVNLAVISAVRDYKANLKKLKTLKMFEMNAPELRVLIDLGRRKQDPLRLEEFSTSILCRQEPDNEVLGLFHTFLLTQSMTLKILDLETEGLAPDTTSTIQIPRLEHLRRFTLRRHGLNMVVVQYDAETLSNNFPALRRFAYNFYCFAPRQMAELDICKDDLSKITHEGLTELELSYSYFGHFGGRGEGLTLALFPPLLPSVTSIDFDLNSNPESMKTLGMVWTMWPALTIIRVRYKQDYNYNRILQLDELLTGVPKSKFKSLRAKLTQPLTLDTVRQLLATHKTKPGISDAEHLREFTLLLNGNTFKLTDIGGYLGFAMLRSGVQRIAIEGAHDDYTSGKRQNQMSSECRELIRSAVGPLAIIKLSR